MEIIEAAHLLGVEKRAKGRVTTKRLERAREEHWRPAVRAECPRDRPCPYVGCRYNLYLDATGAGTIKFNFMHDEIEPMEIDEVPRNCALDYADAGPMTLDEIGAAIGGITRERIRQIEADGLEKMRDRHAGRDDP